MNTKPVNILLIENQQEYIELIRGGFESFTSQFKMDIASTLEEARQYLNNTDYDFAISDLFLPDGEAIEILNELDGKKSFPFIIMSGFGNEKKAKAAIKAGAMDYIIKSSDNLIELPRIIERSIREWNYKTDLEKAEEKIRRTERRFHDLQETLPIGIARTTLDGKIIYGNTALAKIFGYNSVEEILHIKSTGFYANPQDRKILIDKLLADGSVINYETQGNRKDGSLIWISTSLKSVYNENGDLIYIDGFCIDFTEKKETEIAIKKNEALYSALFQHNPIQTVVVDRDGRIIAYNRAKDLSGDRKPEIGDIMYMDYAGKHTIDMHKELIKCILSGKIREFPEQHYFNKILSIKISPFSEGAIITSQDITIQKKAEEELKKSEQMYKLVTDTMLDLLSMCDADGKITFYSLSHKLILGYDQEENIGRQVYEKIHPEDIHDWLAKYEYHKKSLAPDSIVYRCRHKNGHYIWLESVVHCITGPNNEYLGSVFSSRDITGRRKYEEKMEHFNELLYAIRNIDLLISHEKNTGKLIQGICDYLIESRGHTDVWLALIDNKGKITASAFAGPEKNKDLTPYLKNSKTLFSLNCFKQIKNKSIVILDNKSGCKECRFFPEDGNNSRALIRLEYGNKLFGILNIGLLPEIISEGQMKSLLIEIGTDIALGLYNFDLEKERKELEKQLYKSARLSAVGQLAAGIAHEFNNLLSVILGHTQLSLEENSIDEIKLSLKEIEKSTKRGSSIVNKLTAFAKPKEPDFKIQDITKVINDVILLQKRQLHLDTIKIETKFNAKSSLSFDRGQMEQVFLNLIINSIHAIKPKGRGKIIISVFESNGIIEIRFSDNGIGMDKDTKTKIFDPFFTTKGAWAKDGLGIAGTGLGLPIAHSIIKQHNGTISVKSQKNKGTTFIIRLPINTSGSVFEEQPAYTVQGRDTEQLKEMRILLIDDEDEMTDIFKQIFKKAGFKNYIVENNGERAVSLYKKFKPDIVFLDIIMPEMDGEKIFKEIKTLDKTTPIVFMSGKIDSEKDNYLKTGAFDYIQKPFEISEIFNILNRVKKLQIEFSK